MFTKKEIQKVKINERGRKRNRVKKKQRRGTRKE
jgi:hypothetical protein